MRVSPRLLAPAVLQAGDPVEHRLARRMVPAVRHEIPEPLELELVVRLRTGQRGLDVGGHHLQAVRVEQCQEVLAAGIGLGVGEQAVVQAHFGGHAVGHAHPGDGGLHLHAVGPGRAALGVGHHGREHLRHLAFGILLAAGAFDDVAALQPHLVAREEALVALRRGFLEVLALDPDVLAEREVAHGRLRAFGRMGQGGQLAGFQVAGAEDFVPVGEFELHRVQHGHAAGCLVLQVLAQAAFQRGVVDPGVVLGHADALAEQLQGLGRVAAAAQADDGGHAGVVPAVHDAAVHQVLELALAGHHVGQVQARELVLARLRRGDQAALGEAVQQPVVEGALVFELQRADAVGDALQRVLDGMREGVHRVDAPFVAGVVVLGVLDAVDGRIAQVDVGRGHVDLRAQHGCPIRQLAIAHFAEACQVLGGRAGAEGAVHAGLAEIAAVGAHLLGALLVHVGVAGLDQVLGRAVHEVEVVAGLVGRGRAGGLADLRPVEAQPAHGVDDAIDVFLVFLLGVGVVEAQVAHSAIVARQPEIQADAFGMAHVQVAVGLGREAGADLRGIGLAGGVVGGVARRAGPAGLGVGALGEVGFDDLAQEIARFGGLGRRGGGGMRTHGRILGCRPCR